MSVQILVGDLYSHIVTEIDWKKVFSILHAKALLSEQVCAYLQLLHLLAFSYYFPLFNSWIWAYQWELPLIWDVQQRLVLGYNRDLLHMRCRSNVPQPGNAFSIEINIWFPAVHGSCWHLWVEPSNHRWVDPKKFVISIMMPLFVPFSQYHHH